MNKVEQFIDLVGQGQNAQAQEALNDILSAKAFEALESMKQSVGANLFATEEAEQVDEEAEQLDEISAKLGTATYIERLKRQHAAADKFDDAKSDKDREKVWKEVDKHTDKAIDNINRLHDKHGRVASKAAEKKARDMDLI